MAKKSPKKKLSTQTANNSPSGSGPIETNTRTGEVAVKPLPVADDSPILMRLWTGAEINVWRPRGKSIDVLDIAVSLARQCRFSGHLPHHYSVAQHSLNCLLLATHVYAGQHVMALAALLHDAHEAYLGDINGSARKLLTRMFGVDWSRVERHFNDALTEKFGLPEMTFHYSGTNTVDKTVLALEDEALGLGYGLKIDDEFLSPSDRRKISFNFGPMEHNEVVDHFTSNLRHLLGKVRGR